MSNESDKDLLLHLGTAWAATKISPKHLNNSMKITSWNIDKLMGRINEKSFADSLQAIDAREAIDRESLLNIFKKLMSSTNGGHLKCTANGNGEFNINLPAGRYYVLVEYSNREGLESTFEVIEDDQNLRYEFKGSDL